MNRIRKYKDKYQLLITPTQFFNASFEIMRGGWTDEHLRNYYILTYDTLSDAQCEAYKYPDIDWNKMIIMHKDAFYDIKDIIADVIEREKFIVEFESKYLEPIEAKHTMFDRVMYYGKRFSIVNNMNDIITYYITNPWTKNIAEISNKLINEPKLRIFKKIIGDHVIRLIGMTDMSTTYEIVIRTTNMKQWSQWITENPNVPFELKESSYKKLVESQRYQDKQYIVR